VKANAAAKATKPKVKAKAMPRAEQKQKQKCSAKDDQANSKKICQNCQSQKPSVFRS
jgi:hypothetical protein